MENKEIKGFLFYRSFYEACEDLEENERLLFYETIFKYVFDGEEPQFKGALKMAFMMIKPNIDKSLSNYKSKVENGKKGGRPKKANKTENNLNKPNETEQKANETKDKDKDKEIDKEKDNNNDIQTILSLIGNTTNLSVNDHEYIKSWVDDYSMKEIKEAINRTNKKIKVFSAGYCNKVLVNGVFEKPKKGKKLDYDDPNYYDDIEKWCL